MMLSVIKCDISQHGYNTGWFPFSAGLKASLGASTSHNTVTYWSAWDVLGTRHMITLSLSIFSWSFCVLNCIWIFVMGCVCVGRVYPLVCMAVQQGRLTGVPSPCNKRRWLGPQHGAKNSLTAVCEERVNGSGAAPDYGVDGALKHFWVTYILDHKHIRCI